MPMRAQPERLDTLRRLAILDSAPEKVYDELTSSLAGLLGVPIAMVNLLDANRDWFKSCIGLPISESPASASFCEVFFETPDDLVVVNDTMAHPRFSQSPFVQGPPFIRFYVGVRLSVNGLTMGTLCAYDTQPKFLTAQQIDDMVSLAGAAVVALKRQAGSR